MIAKGIFVFSIHNSEIKSVYVRLQSAKFVMNCFIPAAILSHNQRVIEKNAVFHLIKAVDVYVLIKWGAVSIKLVVLFHLDMSLFCGKAL
jgi:hypothetical protein